MGTPVSPARPKETAAASRPASAAPLPDAVLVERAKRGDRTAFGELVARYQDRVYNTVYRMCHNHADALDLSQAAFVKAFEAMPRFQERANFFTWLFRIAINGVITQRRSRRHRQPDVSLDGDGALPLAAPREDPAGAADRDDRVRRVAGALAQLDEEFRAALVLKDVEDLDYATIGEILGVPIGTVKSRIHRGRMMMRELLSEDEPE